MVRPFVKISPDQYEELDRLGKEKKESLSKLIREALSYFIEKKEYSIGVLPCSLPASTEDKYKTVTAYFPQHDWNLLKTISKNTGRCKTELVRKAVEEYLRESR
ncbi:MAG: ribbon-helix-helix domain-containing protein [Candidatus Aerophobus sp.]|nr:MAG: ribbon-helix-helix domain-containing protein [Candidatus Aerophobus sp.]